MKKTAIRIGVLAAMSVLMTESVYAIDLKTAFETALGYDAELLAAKATRDETAEEITLARAPLLPQVGYSYQHNRAKTLTHYINSSVKDQDTGRYSSNSANFNIRQALFRLPAWYALQGAKAQAAAADESYRNETQRAGMRAAANYLTVLIARASLEQAKNHLKTMGAWLDLAEHAFKAGRGTRTDIEDARSRRDLARAGETEARMQLSSAEENFQTVTGIAAESIDDTEALRLDAEQMRLTEDGETWRQRIESNSPELQSLRLQLNAAEAAVDQARSGHLPTIDLVAARQRGQSETHTTVGNQYSTNYVGLQLNMPLISGGSVLGQTAQARARAEKVRQTLESARRKTLAEGNRLLLAVGQGIEQVQALRQSVASAEDAVIGEKKGVQAGTRTFVDALDAERRLSDAKREHAAALFSLANNRLKFLALTGGVNQESIGAISAWLGSAKP